MFYSDVFGGHLMAWVVNEDELDKLYLNFQGDNTFSEQGLEIGYVDLNL